VFGMKKVLQRIVGKSLLLTFVLIPILLLIEIPIFVAGAALATYLVFSRDLPEIPHVDVYQPRTVSTFYADDGTVIGIFYKQRRFVVDLAQIPPHVVNAFLAAEDARFYEHNGVDWQGVARAMVRNLKAGRVVQGGSTITMQETRNFLLTRERTFSRKIKEMVLASRLERVWGKKKILYIYLNEIYLGEGSYGVEAAARGYFDKPVEHLTVAEGALLAGLVAGPARYNPFKSDELARQRQLYVLSRMEHAGFITEQEYQKAKNEKLVFKKDPSRPFDLVPDFAEEVRRYIVKKYGEEKLYNEGLKVFTTCRIDYQRDAQEALDKGLGEIKARQKYLAILRSIPADQINDLLQVRSNPVLTEGKIYQGVVLKVIPKKGETVLDVGLSKRVRGRVVVPHKTAAYKVGQVLALRFVNFAEETPIFSLDDNPPLQGAVVCIENRTGYVRALVGGVSGEYHRFNRAVQAKRQPGSAFKPIIYSVALEEKSYSPATIIVDEPIVVDLDQEEVEWEPKNSGGNFLGPVSLRRALELSRNICTVKVLMDTKFDPVIRMARKMGVSSSLGRNLSLSLGTSEVSLMELTSAYTVFPNSGVHVQPTMVKRIEDRFGNVLEDNTPIPLLDPSEIPHPTPREEIRNDQSVHFGADPTQMDEEDELPAEEQTEKPVAPRGPRAKGGQEIKRVRAAMSPQTAYIMTTLLQGGVRQGTGARMSHYLKRRDLAGKTGTTNKAADTWFVGFNPDFTTGVWVGFDEARPLGRGEEGGRAALPIWGYFMREVLHGKPEKEFPVPPEITFKDMLTFEGTSKEGLVPKTVREPVYTPFVGRTLVISPIDPPETLAEYRGVGSPFGYSMVPGQGMATGQSGSTLPLNPMDGRNLFPEELPPPPQQVLPPQQAPTPLWTAPPPAPPQPAQLPGQQRNMGGLPANASGPVRPPAQWETPPQPPPPEPVGARAKTRYESRPFHH
jgi:penicillin-binding protein 1A